MKQFSVIIFGLFLFSSCRPVQSTEIPATQLPILATQKPVLAAIPISTATPIPCDSATADFCLVDWTFTFQNPLGSNSPLTIARSYSYGSTDNGRREPHRGIDLESKEGDLVYAPAAGVVIFAGRDHERIYTPWDDYYGNLIVIKHEDGLFTLYGHLSQIYVSVGTQVMNGDIIAAVGHTGVAIGSHLHFEVRTGSNGSDFFSTENPELQLPLDNDKGAISIKLDAKDGTKLQRQLVIFRYAPGANIPEEKYYGSTYPKEFSNNSEDFVMGNLPPGRYRIAFTDESGFYERIVNVEAGKLTQVVVQLK